MDINMFKLLADNLPQPIWIKDLDLRFIYCNREYMKIHDGKTKDLIGLGLEEVFSEETARKYRIHDEWVIKTLKPRVEEGYMNGSYRKCMVFPLINNEGIIEAIAGVDTDMPIVEEKDEVIEKHKNLLEMVVNTFPGDIFCKDTEKRYIYANNTFSNHYKNEYTDNIIGKTDYEINIYEEDLLEQFFKEDTDVIENKEEKVINRIYKDSYLEVIKKPLLNKKNEIIGIVGFSTDITNKIKTEEKLKYLSYTDILTGTYNRTFFEVRARELLVQDNLPIGVIMGDVNGLKVVNDSLGHLEGDRLLKIISKILIDVCENIGLVFRTGGDEFVILLPQADKKICNNVIKRINTCCKEFNHEFINISISLGSSVTDNLEKNIYEALNEAEDEVYSKKLFKEDSIKKSIIDSMIEKLNIKNI